VTTLILLCLVVFFFRLGARPLWDIDEGMHAATSKDMILTGDWITPTLNGENFYDKPVLHNWFIAIAFLLFGFTEFAARLPSAVLGLCCVMATYMLGRRMFDPLVGFLGGVILATAIEFIILSRVVIHDISLAFFVTLALLFFYLGFKDDRRRKTCIILFYVASGFAVLAKGPIGILMPAMIIGLFLLSQRELRFLRKMEVGWGSLILFAIAAPWYILISLRNDDYAGYFFITQNLMRFLSPEAHHHQPPLYYLPVLFGGLFPWSFVLPLAIIRSFREGFKRKVDGAVFLLIWFAAILLFFSAASSKLSTYILPLFPAASLLMGAVWHDLLKAPTPALRRGFLISFLFLLGLVIFAALYIWMNPSEHFISTYNMDMVRLYGFGLLMVGSLSVPLVLLLRGHYKASFTMTAVMFVSTVFFLMIVLVPSINPYRSTKTLALKLDRMLAPGRKLAFYGTLKDSALFYTDRKANILSRPGQLRKRLALENKKVYIVIEKKRLKALEEVVKQGRLIKQEGDKYILTNDPSM
jgi:4-amino-4-deoxy-L-arabinose transferase-like glycosyltransferase